MKTPKFTLTAAGTCGLALAGGISISIAQPDSELTGSIAPPPPVAQETPLKRLSTPLLAVGSTSQAKGNIVFSMAGDALNVTGRIEGLEPTQTYHLVIERPGDSDVTPPAGVAAKAPPGSDGPPAVPPSAAGKPAGGKPAEGKPVAGPPLAGTPNEGQPAAGKPDGTTRPAAPGAGTSGTSVSGGKESKTAGDLTIPASSGDLGTVISDSTGGANVNKTLRNVELAPGPNGIMGRTLVVRKVAGDPAAKSTVIATGAIILPSGEGPPVAK